MRPVTSRVWLHSSLVLLIALALLASAPKQPGPSAAAEASAAVSSFRELKDLFIDPPAEFRTIPLWVWNTSVTPEEIDRQLEDFKAKGFGGVFVHPRYGLITEYLSEEWFSLFRYTVQRGRELGLRVWIYDENSFPSGFAGGHVPANMPESFNQGQGLILRRISQLAANDFSRYELILVAADGGFTLVSAEDSGWLDRTGDIYAFEKAFYPRSKWYGGFSYVDLLLEGVTERFIDLTMRGYEKSAGPELGRVVPGIFTDEPNISPPAEEDCIRWTPGLFEKFEDRWGFDLIPHLPSLFDEVGDWRRVRYDYYSLLLDLFIERWSKPWFRYTEDRGLLWTGHYWEHGWPNPFHGGDNMAMYAWHQVPGIDMLFNRFDLGPNAQFGNVRAVKELSSVANQMGRTRTLSETYGAAGWELTFEEMKRLGDWEYALGVNLMNQHLSYMTLMGDRKHDFPQSFSYHTPWWHLYRYQADYFARLSAALSSGRQVNPILILEPTTTTWMYAAPKASGHESNRLMMEVGRRFQDFITKLERRQIEYDLASERLLAEFASVEGSSLVVGERDYELVVLPPGLDNVDRKTLALIEALLGEGGRILAFDRIPGYVDGKASARLADLAREYGSGWLQASDRDHPEQHPLLQPEGMRFQTEPETPELLFHHRRRLEDGQLIFVVNSSLTQEVRGTVEVEGDSVLTLDPWRGEIRRYPCEDLGSKLEISFNLKPSGSLLWFVAEAQPGDSESSTAQRFPAKSPERSDGHPLQPLGPLEVRPLESNVLTLDYCGLLLGGKEENGLYFYAASDKIFKHHGFNDNPWVSSVQFRSGILDRRQFPPDSGFTARFWFEVARLEGIGALQLVVERPQFYEVRINGQPVRPIPEEWWLDRSFGVFDLGGKVRTGRNSIELEARPMNIHCELAPVYLIGDFGLSSRGRGWELVPYGPLSLGSWKAQGMPFYSGAVSYRRSFPVEQNKTYRIALGDWKGSVAEVRINGGHRGIICHPPYELEVSEGLEDGRSLFEVIVYGSLKNLLGPHHNVERRGIVTPWSFKYAPEKQPAGVDYDLLDYGLYEPFEVQVLE